MNLPLSLLHFNFINVSSVYSTWISLEDGSKPSTVASWIVQIVQRIIAINILADKTSISTNLGILLQKYFSVDGNYKN